MTLTDCQIFMTVSQLGTFAAAAEQMHLTPSAISHAVSGMESECGFPLFTRTKSGVTMTAAAESLLPSIRQMLNSSELLSQSIAQVNGMHKGVLRLGVFNSACVTWVPQLVPPFQKQFPGIDVQLYQGSYADIVDWLKGGTVELLNRSTMIRWSASPPPTTSPAAPAACGPRNCRAGRLSASNPTWTPTSKAILKRMTCT